MPVFDAPTTEPKENTTSNEDDQNTTDFLERVVEEKGEHWKDPSTLAKGYFHAQQRIKELESIAEKAKEQDYAKQLLEQLTAQQAKDDPSEQEVVGQEQGVPDEASHTSLTPEDIDRLLESKLSARQKQQKVEEALRSKFGDGANRVVHDRAKELGLSIEKMQELASESPDAFLRLVGEPTKPETNQGAPSSVNSQGFNSRGTERNSAYYSKLRRENRKLYDSAKVQKEMIDDRIRLGDKFYT